MHIFHSTNRARLKFEVSCIKLHHLSLSFTSHVLTLMKKSACNINTDAACASLGSKWAMHHLYRSMHDVHLDRIISSVEVEQHMSGPHNRAQLESFGSFRFVSVLEFCKCEWERVCIISRPLTLLKVVQTWNWTGSHFLISCRWVPTWDLFWMCICVCICAHPQGAVITPAMDHAISMQPANMMGPLTQQMNHLSLGTTGTVS